MLQKIEGGKLGRPGHQRHPASPAVQPGRAAHPLGPPLDYASAGPLALVRQLHGRPAAAPGAPAPGLTPPRPFGGSGAWRKPARLGVGRVPAARFGPPDGAARRAGAPSARRDRSISRPEGRFGPQPTRSAGTSVDLG